MATSFRDPLSAETTVNADIDKIWKCWNSPEDIMQWNNPTTEWYTSKVENDLRPGGRFLFKMGLKDGSFDFDFEGVYDSVETKTCIRYTLGDGRRSEILFTGSGPVRITETFVPENSQPLDLQQEFCAAVLDGFKRYVEGKA